MDKLKMKTETPTTTFTRFCFVDKVRACGCSGTACEKKYMESSTPTTELRIEMNIRLPENAAPMFEDGFKDLLAIHEVEWSGAIVPNPDPTGMSLYKVEEVEGLRNEIAGLWKSVESYQSTQQREKQAFLDMTRSYEFEREERNRLDNLLRSESWKSRGLESNLKDKDLKIKSLETKLRLKENTWWKTFIKWVKEAWNGLWK